MNDYRANDWNFRLQILSWSFYISAIITYTIKSYKLYYSEENDC